MVNYKGVKILAYSINSILTFIRFYFSSLFFFSVYVLKKDKKL